MFDINFPWPIFSKQHGVILIPGLPIRSLSLGRHRAVSLFCIVIYSYSLQSLLFDFNYLDELIYHKKESARGNCQIVRRASFCPKKKRQKIILVKIEAELCSKKFDRSLRSPSRLIMQLINKFR